MNTPPTLAEGLTTPLTLADAVFIALRENRGIKAAYLQRIAQKFDLRVAEDKFTPKLVLSSRYLAEHANSSTAGGEADSTINTLTGTFQPTVAIELPTGGTVAVGYQWSRQNILHREDTDGSSVAVTIEQPLLRGGGVDVAMASVRLARLSEKINRQTLASSVSQTVTDVIVAYREVIRSQEQLKIAERSLQRAKDLIRVNNALIAAGRMARTDLIQTEAEVHQQEIAVLESQSQLAATKLSLLTLLGVSQESDVVAVESMRTVAAAIEVQTAVEIARDSQPALLAQQLAIEQAQIELDLAKNERLWDVSLVGTAIIDDDRSDIHGRSQRTDLVGGVQVTIPLNDLTDEQREVTAAVSLRVAKLELSDLDAQVGLAIRNAVRDVDVRWRQYQIARSVSDAAGKKLVVEQRKLELGRSSNFEVLSFEADLRQAEVNELSALLAHQNAITALDLQLGTTLQTWGIALND